MFGTIQEFFLIQVAQTDGAGYGVDEFLDDPGFLILGGAGSIYVYGTILFSESLKCVGLVSGQYGSY